MWILEIIREHSADIRHNRYRTSALAEHVEKSCRHVCIEDSKVIARVDHFHHRKLREAIEIEQHAKNLNYDDGWKLRVGPRLSPSKLCLISATCSRILCLMDRPISPI